MKNILKRFLVCLGVLALPLGLYAGAHPEAMGTGGVPVGTPFCFDFPTCNTICEDVGGNLECTANTGTYVWDGSLFDINGGGAVTGISVVGAELRFSHNGATLWRIQGNSLRSVVGTGPGMIGVTGNITTPVIIPHFSCANCGLSSDGVGATGVVASGALGLTVDASGAYVVNSFKGAFATNGSTTQSLLAATTITPDAGMIHIVGNGGAVTLTSNPMIANGTDGQHIVVCGTSETNTVTLSRGLGVRMNVATLTLANNDCVQLAYSAVATDWLQTADAADNDGT